VTFALSDLVRGLVVLSVHPRQAEVAPGAAKAFGFSIPAGVHETDMPKYLGNVRCWVNSGKHLLSLSFSVFDGGLNRSTQHFILEGKMECSDGSGISSRVHGG
jgi:hypothetical protein